MHKSIRYTLLAIVLVAGLALSMMLDPGRSIAKVLSADESAPAVPTFDIFYSGNSLSVRGHTNSSQHNDEILSIVASEFAGAELELTLLPSVLLPADWVPLTSQLLYSLAATRSGSATIDHSGIRVRAVTDDPGRWRNRFQSLLAITENNRVVNDDIIAIDPSVSLESICAQMLDAVPTGQIAFAQSASQLRSSSYAVLDRLVDLSIDCHNSTIAIVGHTDALGGDSLNLELSTRRARAVADYLVTHGVAARQLLVEGRGSSEPVADNDTVYGRSRNRRIEVEIRATR